MAKCGKGCMPECEYFTTGGCISPFNCMYKEESRYINSATSGTVIYTRGMNMTNDELKNKIVLILRGNVEYNMQYYPEDNRIEIGVNYDNLADALIAAGIGDVEHERFVFKKAYMDFFTKLNLDKNFRKNFDSITLGCQIGKFEDMIEQAEKELAEERKDD
jgi:hypothetical protein